MSAELRVPPLTSSSPDLPKVPKRLRLKFIYSYLNDFKTHSVTLMLNFPFALSLSGASIVAIRASVGKHFMGPVPKQAGYARDQHGRQQQ